VRPIYGVILGPYNVTTPETFVTLNMVAIGTGNANLALSNVVISDPNGVALPLSIVQGDIKIRPKYDINLDGLIDITDLNSITALWGIDDFTIP
jgi:hypothetical protein